MTTRYIDIHVLQNVPPSNINRDDTGAPKTAVYGGVQRARVSSQAWKRATRFGFHNDVDQQSLGVRTTRIVTLIADKIAEINPGMKGEAAAAAATAVVKAAGLKLEKPKIKKDADETASDQDTNERSQYLIFLSAQQISKLAELAAQSQGNDIDKKEVKSIFANNHSLDVAMFGRMVADDKDLNVDAAVQVAHALSVHGVDNEYDYFTAVDDKNADDAGAGMIGTVEFNSSTLYRYATINLDGLKHNLGSVDATAAAAAAFVKSFTTSMPTGKQNTFANRTLPDAVVVMVRSSQPVNLIGAFEKPITAPLSEDRFARACTALADYAHEVDQAYGTQPAATYVVRVGDRTQALTPLGKECNLSELTQAIDDSVRQSLADAQE